ncbi:MAG: alpha/beta hydrolase [Desulfobacterales bacterium]|nr:alpha/beta hydrolase [Desulfobacterales bacterium]
MTPPFSFFKTYDDLSIRYAVRLCRSEQKAGSLILLGGRREFIEKYTETIAELNGRNFDVYAMDWRGQGLSGRQLPNRHKGYVRSYDDYLEDLNRFFREVIQPRAVLPCIILAHSMGGHIALRYLHDHPDCVAKAILTAPMIDIALSPFKVLLIRVFARFAVSAGMDKAYVQGSGDYRAVDQNFNGNRLTSDPRRFTDEQRAIHANPDLALGGVTYGWLKATLESIDILKGTGYPEAIRTPVLIVGADCDRVVSLKSQEQICERLPFGRIRIIPQARHEVLKETDQVRGLFWQAFDRFVETQREPLKHHDDIA